MQLQNAHRLAPGERPFCLVKRIPGANTCTNVVFLAMQDDDVAPLANLAQLQVRIMVLPRYSNHGASNIFVASIVHQMHNSLATVTVMSVDVLRADCVSTVAKGEYKQYTSSHLHCVAVLHE